MSMKILQKIALFAVLLVSGLQLSAKNKERILVINNYGSDILVRNHKTVMFYNDDDIVIKNKKSKCLDASRVAQIAVFDNDVILKGFYYDATEKVKSGNVVVVTKKSKYAPKLKVYKNKDDFMKANQGFKLDDKICPSVLPAA